MSETFVVVRDENGDIKMSHWETIPDGHEETYIDGFADSIAEKHPGWSTVGSYTGCTQESIDAAFQRCGDRG